MYPSGSKTDTSLGNSQLMLQTHLHACTPTTVQKGTRKKIPECATLMLWQEYELSILSATETQGECEKVNLGQAQTLDRREVLGKAEEGHGPWELRLKSEVSVEMKTVCSWGFPTPNIPFP